MVTLTGPGGTGKTRLGLQLAAELLDHFADGAFFVSLAPISDPALVTATIAQALAVRERAGETLDETLADFLRERQIVLLLDNFEQVLGGAPAVSALLAAAPRLKVLVTSRAPLRVRPERELAVPPLQFPDLTELPDLDALSRCEAVALFVERAREVKAEFALTRENAPAVAEICIRLDGLPLAIELAAPRVEVLGVEGLAARLDDSLLLGARRRTAMPRHRTMRAVVDWSYGLLSEDEQLFFRALGIFSGGFTVEAAAAVAIDSADARGDTIDRLAGLVAKSLVVADVSGAKPRFRLLDTTRAYAIEMLDESSERERIARRHAEYYRDLFERTERQAAVRPAGEWLADYAPEIDNLRAALDWALSQGGDGSIGVALTAAAVPLWFEMWLLEECRARAEQALSIVEREEDKDDDQRMRLYAAVALSQAFTTRSIRDTRATWVAALHIAQALKNTEYQLRALWGLWGTHVNRGEFKEGIAIATQFSQLAAAKSDSSDQLVGDRITGAVWHFLGDQRKARTHIERMLAFYVTPACGSTIVRFQSDQRVTAQMYLARILWLQGAADRAAHISKTNVEDAIATKHPQSLCNALAGAACPIALLTGDIETAERYISMLLDLTTREALELWHAHAICFEGQLLLGRGEVRKGLAKLQAGIDRLARAEFNQYIVAFLGPLAEALATINDISRALEVIDDALARSERYEAKWFYPELLRIKGSILLRTKETADSEAAQDQFLTSLEVAREQSALAWELRTSTSLARLRQTKGWGGEAHTILRSVCDRFTEGHETADLRIAAALLKELATS